MDARHAASPAPLVARWLGRVAYRDAWDLQKALAAARAADAIPDQLLLLEHPPVLTLGRQADDAHVLAPAPMLEARGIEVIRVERGGEVTYHGPGQLVAYPIVRLADRGLYLREYVRALEAAMADTCAAEGVTAGHRDGHPGCWIDPDGPLPRKVGALGVRVERGVAYHGIALNVTTNLADFGLIDPCGTPGLRSASIAAELGRRDEPPSTASVESAARVFGPALARHLGGDLVWDDGDPRAPLLVGAATARQPETAGEAAGGAR
ncbi:MAG TPA: lipoyl(octanoyl) transferase LipB [Candidatus Limnocylindrales bacterium]